jgi:DNA protecting protein DprA
MTREEAILRLYQTEGLGNRTLSRILDRLDREGLPAEEFIRFPEAEMVKHYGIKPRVAQAIQIARSSRFDLLEELRSEGVRVLTKGGPDYPPRLIRVLKDIAPPVLFVRGNVEILKRRAVGFCGSRKASDKGLAVTHRCAVLLAGQGINVVSGYAHGVDLATHRGALEAGGVTTFVLAEGILRYKVKQEIGDVLKDDNYVVVSEFSPRMTWATSNAMQRNETICGLSNAVVVIESGISGGTFAAGESAMRLHRPLFVVEYQDPPASAAGNRYFLDKGAVALKGNKEGIPNISELLRVLDTEENEKFVRYGPEDLFESQPTTVAVHEPSVSGKSDDK